MPCYFPLTAYQTASGSLYFVERRHSDSDFVRTLQLPCGRCIGCRLERARQWSIRIIHEASLYTPENCFVTLTYSDEHLPERGMLQHRDFQLFLKRLRKYLKTDFDKKVRFFMCGEYGETTFRPHYHMILFNHAFYEDRVYYGKSATGKRLYSSPVLDQLWSLGACTLGDVTFESANYVARYCTKVITGDAAEEHYTRADAAGVYRLPPEYCQMSRRPGLGRPWYDKYKDDVYPHDYVVVNGKRMKPPRFYDRIYKDDATSRSDDVEYNRDVMSRKNYHDNIPERLEVKAVVAEAGLNLKKRTYG